MPSYTVARETRERVRASHATPCTRVFECMHHSIRDSHSHLGGNGAETDPSLVSAFIHAGSNYSSLGSGAACMAATAAHSHGAAGELAAAPPAVSCSSSSSLDTLPHTIDCGDSLFH